MENPQVAPQVESPMLTTPARQSRSKTPLVAGMGVLVFLLLGLTGLLAYQNLQLKQQLSDIQATPTPQPTSIPRPTQPPATPTEGADPIANWKEHYYSGLSFKFPPTLQGYNLGIIEMTTALYPDRTSVYLNATNSTASEGTDSDVGFIITRVENPDNLSAVDWWNKNITRRELIVSNVKEQDYALRNVTIDSYTLFFYKHKFVFDQGYLYKGKNSIYLFSEQLSANNPAFTESLFNQILSTFQFLD